MLVTGNLGYIGIELTKFLKKKNKNLFIIGYDVGYFKSNFFLKKKISKHTDYQIRTDLREDLFKQLEKFKIDAIIHLAAISNDPMGNYFINPTRQINTSSSKKLVNWAKKSGVSKFIFASSCSVYGFSKKVCNENSKTNPLTEYAKSKITIEKYLNKKTDKKFKAICLRFSTACGASEMLRLDLVLNDFVASAITSNEIRILSDGKALRPLIDVTDMAEALYWALSYDPKNFLSVNVGNEKMNYQIIELASLVKKYVKTAKISVNQDNKDNRSYRVDFSKYRKIFPRYSKMKNAKFSIMNLIKMIRMKKFADKKFRTGNFMRLVSLKKQIEAKKINRNLKILNDRRN